MSLPVQRNATARNEQGPKMLGVGTRFEIFTSGAQKGSVAVTPFTDASKGVDFPRINPLFAGKAYCFYYAVEWMHDGLVFGSMAILKQNLCDKSVPNVYWYRPGHFPSEPTFVPNSSGGAAAEDDGVLLFSLMNGATKETQMMIVDAASMQTLDAMPVPTTMTFTTHGAYYDGLLKP